MYRWPKLYCFAIPVDKDEDILPTLFQNVRTYGTALFRWNTKHGVNCTEREILPSNMQQER